MRLFQTILKKKTKCLRVYRNVPEIFQKTSEIFLESQKNFLKVLKRFRKSRHFKCTYSRMFQHIHYIQNVPELSRKIPEFSKTYPNLLENSRDYLEYSKIFKNIDFLNYFSICTRKFQIPKLHQIFRVVHNKNFLRIWKVQKCSRIFLKYLRNANALPLLYKFNNDILIVLTIKITKLQEFSRFLWQLS